MLNPVLDADKALEIGLITRVVPDAELKRTSLGDCAHARRRRARGAREHQAPALERSGSERRSRDARGEPGAGAAFGHGGRTRRTGRGDRKTQAEIHGSLTMARRSGTARAGCGRRQRHRGGDGASARGDGRARADRRYRRGDGRALGAPKSAPTSCASTSPTTTPSPARLPRASRSRSLSTAPAPTSTPSSRELSRASGVVCSRSISMRCSTSPMSSCRVCRRRAMDASSTSPPRRAVSARAAAPSTPPPRAA